jgi:hypothetical protein
MIVRFNFEIVDGYALKIGRRFIDLHNCFEFSGYRYEAQTRDLILNWYQSKGNWVDNDELKALSLIHKHVDYVKIEKQNGIIQDDECLEQLGYYPSADRDYNEFVQMHTTPTSEDDVIYRFQSGWFIRIKAEEIVLVI